MKETYISNRDTDLLAQKEVKYLTLNCRFACVFASVICLSLLTPQFSQAGGTLYHSHQAIRQVAEQHALKAAKTAKLSVTSATAGSLDPRLKLMQCNQPLSTAANTNYNRAGRTTVQVTCSAPKPWKLYVPVAVAAHVNAVVINRSLPRGSILQASDVKLVKRSTTALNGQHISDLNSVIGKELKRPVSANSLLNLNIIAAPHVVRRGQTVTILAEAGSLQVRMQGEALKDGSEGELIKIKNVKSGRTVQGTVNKDGSVSVHL